MIVVTGGTRNCASHYGTHQVERYPIYAGNQCSHNSSRSDRGSGKPHDKHVSPRKRMVPDQRQRLSDHIRLGVPTDERNNIINRMDVS